MSGEESRADRLRRRRGDRSRERDVDDGQEPHDGETAGETGESTSEQEPSGVKAERVGTYLYLPPEQRDRVDRLFKRLRAKYELEYDEEIQKNRHYYPLLVEHGLESLEDLDASELQTMLEKL